MASARTNINGKNSIIQLLVPIAIIVVSLLPIRLASAGDNNVTNADAENLLKFKKTIEDKDGVMSNWNTSKPPCTKSKRNWAGILCTDNGTVWGLKLESLGLKGEIHVDSLSQIRTLITISLMNNSFDGPLPDLRKLGNITSIYLSNNKFSGDIPIRAFEGMIMLKKLHLARNEFTGPIPWSLAIIPRLAELNLEDNSFDGEIPEFTQKRLPRVNLSNNSLQGAIPYSLSKLNADSFAGQQLLPYLYHFSNRHSHWKPFVGNSDLCGRPLDACASSEKVSLATLLVILVVITIAIAATVAGFIILCNRRKSNRKVVSEVAHGSRKLELTFLRDDRQRFDLGDLLKASAEILGSGVFGSSYKAALGVGPVMVVKRFRQMNNAPRDEFQEHMRRLGRLRHANVLPLVAFYYRKEEKLLVSDYVESTSLAVYLYGNKQPGLDWAARLKVVKGVARGLVYLYNGLPSLIAPHGHLKSSNVLLNESFEPTLTDYGLIPIINQEHAQELMIAYKSPEYKQNGRITKKTDVWSLGVLILELLTGKFPATAVHQGKGNDTDLASWVQSVAREEATKGDVFDKDIKGAKNSQGEMSKLLKIALSCCEVNMEKRLDIKETAERIDDLREMDT